MRYRLRWTNLGGLGSYIFFFTITDNRFMVYMPVLIIVYMLRFMYAFRGYQLLFRNIKATGKIGYPRLLLLQLLFATAIIISGAVNGNNTPGIIYSIFTWIGISNYILAQGVCNMKFLKALDIMFKLVMTGTLLLTVLLPDLMVTYSYDGSKIVEGFFGGKNALPMYLLMGLCLDLLVYELVGENKLWRQFIYPVVCALLLLVSGSGTGSVIAAIFLVSYYTGLYKLLNTYSIVLIHTAFIISIVVCRLHERYFYPLIVNTLHRDITLTYRTDIWTIAISGFKNNWFMGYGLGNDIIAQNLVLPDWYTQIINETHNGVLDIALSLGLMGLVPFLAFIASIVRAYDKSGNKRISQIMKLYVFVYFVIAITESAFTLSRLTFWSMLFIGLALARQNSACGSSSAENCHILI